MKWMMLVLAFIPLFLFAQSRKEKKIIAARQKADELVVSSLKENFSHLLNETSSEPASSYLAAQFHSAGLQPKGLNNYQQSLQLDKGKQIDASTFLKINGEQLSLKKEYFPLGYSASKRINGMPAMALREKGVPWFLDLKEWSAENGLIPESILPETIQKEAARMAAKGATALILYNSGSDSINIRFDGKAKITQSPIPVVYIMHEGYEKYLRDKSQILDIELNVSLKEANYTVVNIEGSIDNNAPSTIAIAAFYNNNIKGESQLNSEKVKKEDNAVASAMLIELAKMLAASKAKNYNYLFVAFDAKNVDIEDESFLPEITVATPVRCIVNVNNAIIYNDDKKILLEGYNEANFDSPELVSALAEQPLEVTCTEKKEIINTASVNQNKTPVLSFSNVHFENANSPASDSKINFARQFQLTKFIFRLVDDINAKSKIPGKKGL